MPVRAVHPAEPISASRANSSGAQNPASDSETEKQRAQADLEAQQDMALWAKWMVAVSAVSVFISGGAVVLVYLTMREAGKTTKGRAEGRFYNCGPTSYWYDVEEKRERH